MDITSLTGAARRTDAWQAAPAPAGFQPPAGFRAPAASFQGPAAAFARVPPQSGQLEEAMQQNAHLQALLGKANPEIALLKATIAQQKVRVDTAWTRKRERGIASPDVSLPFFPRAAAGQTSRAAYTAGNVWPVRDGVQERSEERSGAKGSIKGGPRGS